MNTAFFGNSIMARKIALYDWTQHPLGHVDAWPAALRTALGMILDSGFPMFLVWTDHYYAFYNDAYMPLLGDKEPRALGRCFADLWSEAWAVVGPIADKAYAGEQTYFEDLPIVIARHQQPEQAYFSFSYSPVRDEKGSVAGVLCTVFETTGKVLSMARLKDSEDRLQLSLEASGNIGTWSVDLETGITTVDARFARLFGVDQTAAERGDLILSEFTDGIYPEDRQRVVQAIADAMVSGEPYEEEYRLNPAGETQVWVAARGQLFADQRTAKRRFAGIAVEITQRKQTENDLRRLADDLAKSNQRQQEFIAVLAHELRNPLAPIRTGLDLIAASQDAPATTARVRKMMTRQVDHLVHLVDDLLDLARITNGKIVPKMARAALEDVVLQAIETTRPAIDAKQHRLTVSFPDNPVWLHVDTNRIVQVIVNVLSNAAKYTPPKGEIDLTVSRIGDEVLIVVTDNGIGIEAAALPHVFDMFNQADRRSEYAQGGLGIGLALTKRITEMHRGAVSMASAGLNCGSVVTIQLPVVDATSRTAAKPLGMPGSSQTVRPMRILLADDNADALNMLAQVLESEGHQVRKALNGQQGLSIAREWVPDLAILDLGMPLLNGYETAQAMRACPTLSAVHLMALTGWGAQEDRIRTAQAGFNKHFTKPLDFTELRSYLALLSSRPD